MLPSLSARQLQDTLVDYVQATIDMRDPTLAAAFEAKLRGSTGLFRGPYVCLGLPFRTGQAAASPLTISPTFDPYAHQLQAFAQLHTGGVDAPHNTLVTTGTGSGKTECFLYPLLDHCWRHMGQPGIKAILIYPMNALATDQARRLAQILHSDPRLSGLRAGLYVGGEGKTAVMGPDQIIEDKAVLREYPPDILLTNYKMLDFMLLRPDERPLWSHNGPKTLRYLVLDELHTFDGAQGSDVACLLRRLKARLGTPAKHLVCAGTSATIGDAADAASFENLAAFAELVFDEPFHAEHVVREHRLDRAAFLTAPLDLPVPDAPLTGDLRAALDPPVGSPPSVTLEGAMQLWLGRRESNALALGTLLQSHLAVHHLLALAADRPAAMDPVLSGLVERLPSLAALPSRDLRLAVDGLLGLISHARRQVGPKVLPLLTVQVQLWARELRRLLRVLPDQRDGVVLPPAFAWESETTSGHLDDSLLAHQAVCRECGNAGLAACQLDEDVEHARLRFDAAEVGKHWTDRSRHARFVWPRPLDPARREGELVHWLDPQSGTLANGPFTDHLKRPRGVPVVIEASQTTQSKRFLSRCPRCGSDDALSIVGARAASLASVAVTHLFQQDPDGTQVPKLLAFTDSVQDASHRAGFFGGRTYRIHLRTAMAAAIAAHDPVPLDQAAQAFEDHWRPHLGDTHYLAAFLPHDLLALPEFLAFKDAGGKGQHPALWQILRERIGWELTREIGVAAPIGRSLERTGVLSAEIDEALLDAAGQRLSQWLATREQATDPADATHFLRGLCHRLRHMGGIHHPFLDRYVRSMGNRYELSRQRNPTINPMGPRSKRLRFFTDKGQGDTFHGLIGRRARAGWVADWAQRALGWPDIAADDLRSLAFRAMALLTELGVVRTTSAGTDGTVWGLEPGTLQLTCDLAALRTSASRVDHVARRTAQGAHGRPSSQFRARSSFSQEPVRAGYYAAIYQRGHSTRIRPGEHTGLLDRETRTTVERRFLEGSTAEDPLAPNLLVCTPTLEMGVDIGDLSATMLCSVPPEPSNYLQRVGRAGRATGNALIFVIANAKPHDLYFHSAPEEMLAGVVRPPGAFLGATEMLKRQAMAWCMDDWARVDKDAGPVPRDTARVLSQDGFKRFPGRMLEHLRAHEQALHDSFLQVFGREVDAEGQAALSAWFRSVDEGMETYCHAAFDLIREQIQYYQSERRKALGQAKKIKDDPTLVGNPDVEIKELSRYARVLEALIDELRRRYPLEVLTDASVLPNYAFPETGVSLHSMLGSSTQGEDGEKKRVYEKRAYVRPAARALRELAPFATFYAEGHKVLVRQLELGPKASRVLHARFCPSCHHHAMPVDPSAVITQPCPQCESPGWAGKDQVRALLPLTTVRSVSDRVRSTTADDAEERERQPYNIHRIFDVRAEHLDGEAVRIAELGFGFEFLRQVQMVELNLGIGQPETLQGPTVYLAGTKASVEGFLTCTDCGTVLDDGPLANARTPQHSPFCPQRGNDTKPRIPLSLYRQVRSEALRFLLPISEMHVEQRVRSFAAALFLGLREHFRGRPMHLQIQTMNEPRRDDPQQRKHFLVLFDMVPGGTGYLRSFRDRRRVFDLLGLALERLQECSCQTRGQDGCYLCLFSAVTAKYLPDLSSKVAQEMLSDVLSRQSQAEVVEGGLSEAPVDGVLESELEEKFLARLQDTFKGDLVPVDGGAAWQLKVGATLWRLVFQVDVSELAGQKSRADAVITAISGPNLGERIVVECDGFAYHVEPDQPSARLVDDVRKRRHLAAQPGVRVLTLTWHDLDKKSALVPAPAPISDIDERVWSTLFDRMRKKEGEHVAPLAKLPKMGSLELLDAWLRYPTAPWDKAAQALIIGSLLTAFKRGELLDSAGIYTSEDHLRNNPQASPLPMVRVHKDPRHTVWGRRGTTGSLHTLVSGSLADIKVEHGPSLSVLLRLDDDKDHRAASTYNATWRSAWLAWNVLQKLPTADLLLSSSLESATSVQDMFADMGLELAAEPAGGVYAFAPTADLEAALAGCLDDAARDIVRAVHKAGLPLPDPEATELLGELPTEISWTPLKVAVGRSQDLDSDDLDRIREAGWTLLLQPVNIDVIAPLLRSPPGGSP